MAVFTAIGVALGASAAAGGSAFAVGAAATALGASVIGTGVSMYGQHQQAKTAERAGERNAQIQEAEALQTEMDARENVRRQRATNDRAKKTQRQRYANAGVINEGTPLEVMAETAGLLELDALDISRTAKAKAERLRSSAESTRQGGKDRGSALRIAQGATLLSGVSRAATIAPGLKP